VGDFTAEVDVFHPRSKIDKNIYSKINNFYTIFEPSIYSEYSYLFFVHPYFSYSNYIAAPIILIKIKGQINFKTYLRPPESYFSFS